MTELMEMVLAFASRCFVDSPVADSFCCAAESRA